MSGEYEKDFESGTERRRSRSGVPDSSAPLERPLGEPRDGERPNGDLMNPPHREGDPTEESSLSSLPGREEDFPEEPRALEKLRRQRRRQVLRKAEDLCQPLSGPKKILLLDTWKRSGLAAREFAALTGVTKESLYAWRRKFLLEGPAGLMEKPRGTPRGSRLPDLTQRTILMLKEAHP